MQRSRLLLSRHGLDGLLIAACIVAAAVFAQGLSARLPSALGSDFARDVWFQADLNRTAANLTSRFSFQERSKVHPVASLVAIPLTKALHKVVPQEPFRTAQLLLAIVAGFWAGGIFVLCRSLGGSRIAAIGFSALAVSSAAFVFWFSVPETYGLGSLAILAALVAAARAERRPLSALAVSGVSAATLAMTVTNWMAGLALAFAALPWRRALRATAIAFAGVALLAVVQLAVMPTSRLFFLGSAEEAEYINVAAAGSWWNRLAALLLHAFLVPHLQILPVAAPFWPRLSVQAAAPALQSLSAAPALLAWIVLLGLGAWGAWRSWREGRRRVYLIVLGATLAGQIGLHLVYGEETFLYVLHPMPALVGLAMLGAFTRLRGLAIALALGAAPIAAMHNVGEFADAARTTAQAAVTERDRVLRAMAARPGDSWSRGLGHVVLGEPGSALAGKAYHEPGAAFSPAPGSFGVSLWALDVSGRVLATSETLPADAVAQRFVRGAGPGSPAIRTVTPYYTAEWRHVEGRSELRLGPGSGPAPATLRVVIRSIGPSGGPLRRLESLGRSLDVDDRWTASLPEATEPWQVGDESGPDGLRLGDATAPARASSRSGWLFASAPVDPVRPAMLTLARTRPVGTSPTLRGEVAPLWEPVVPDADFAASAPAQQAHLLMGLTDGTTRPGEPLNYGFSWTRDAAYVVVALVRSGQTAIARRLALQLAERDFTGGFGAEADGPGLATWALGEVAQVVRDPAFDRAIWPHVQRKMGYVTACLEATGTVEALAQNPREGAASDPPARPDAICERAWRGLVVGRMDNGYPVLFVNATAAAGLSAAAVLAERLGERDAAQRWRDRAQGVKAAWQKVLLDPTPAPRPFARGLVRWLSRVAPIQFPAARRDSDIEDEWLRAANAEHTYVNGEWPVSMTSGSAAVRERYVAGLSKRWDAVRDEEGEFRERPLWTYFQFAEAHQWLLLGRPDRAWQTLGWFFRHASSPGLYSWWEGQGEENSTHRWLGVRGWVLGGGGVTPHYWTAAEALLLQLDMLVRVDESDPARPVLIGAGVPSAWATSSIDSGTVFTARGPVRWRLRGDTVEVAIDDPAVPVVLAPGLVLAGKSLRVARRPAESAAVGAP